jgi:glycosyltransferase involved in cell wall biosynthesis
MSTKTKPRIVVSHPGKQYVHQLLYALQREGYLQLFITSIWYKPSFWVYQLINSIPIIGKIIFHKFLKKKTFANQQDELIEQYPWKEMWRQILVQVSTKYRSEKYVFTVEKAHDKYVARRLRKLRPDIFIGYEKSSLESFKEIKRQGGIAVLDLAQVHYKYLIELRDTQETFNDLFEDKALFDEINRVKAEEYQYADYILTLSEFAKSTLVKYGIDERKIYIANIGFNPAIFIPKTEYYKKLTVNPQLKLIYTGTFTKRKGVHLLLQAVKELDLPGLELTIIGPVLDGKELLDEYKGFFKYYDFLHHEELVKHIHESDVYVFPSYLDSWAMTVIEAMACGLPVIVTENTGAKSAVIDGENGFIIPINDLEVLKSKIRFFYNQAEVIKKIGERAEKNIRELSIENYANSIGKIIEEIQLNK